MLITDQNMKTDDIWGQKWYTYDKIDSKELPMTILCVMRVLCGCQAERQKYDKIDPKELIRRLQKGGL